jgi:hypothetical protein
VDIEYPESLPCAQPGAFAPRDRRAVSGIDGPLQMRARQRDLAGTPSQYTFTYTADQMAIWRAWYQDTLLNGRRWFRINLPGRAGMQPRIARYQSMSESLLGLGIYRVTASFEQRGASATPSVVELPAVEYLGSVWTTTSTVDVPTHIAGDILVAIKRLSSFGTAYPGLISGWTTPSDGLWIGASAGIGFDPPRYRLMYLIDTDNSFNSIAAGNNEMIVCLVYRNLRVGTISAQAFGGTPAAAAPIIESTGSAGYSWFMQYAHMSTAIAWTGNVVERIVKPIALGGGRGVVTDTNAYHQTSPSVTYAMGGGNFGMVVNVELKPVE